MSYVTIMQANDTLFIYLIFFKMLYFFTNIERHGHESCNKVYIIIINCTIFAKFIQ